MNTCVPSSFHSQSRLLFLFSFSQTQMSETTSKPVRTQVVARACTHMVVGSSPQSGWCECDAPRHRRRTPVRPSSTTTCTSTPNPGITTNLLRSLPPQQLNPFTMQNAQDFGDGVLECTVEKPQKDNEGTKDAYISYLVTTQVSLSNLPSTSLSSSSIQTTFATFQKPETKVRRRFTDFVFLYNSLCREYPAVAVPPLPEKHNMAYVRGDRFGTDFTQRRSHSLHRFLKRISLHPELRRAAILLQVGRPLRKAALSSHSPDVA